ncbi:MAG: ABC transporter permease, partial [Persicimonas sp.]
MSNETHNPEEDSRSWLARALGSVGRPVLEVYETVQDIFRVLGLTFHYIVHGQKGPKRRDAVLEQMHEIGNRSILFIAVTLGFLGMILIFQAGYQANQITGDLQLLGALFLQLLLREFG